MRSNTYRTPLGYYTGYMTLNAHQSDIPATRRGPHPANHAALRRLRNIEGQIIGISRMIEEERYCTDILTQISAVRAALNSLGLIVLKRHLDHCVAAAARDDGKELPQVVDELMAVLARTSI